MLQKMATKSILSSDQLTMQQAVPWQRDLCREPCVAGIVVLGVVGLEDLVEWWD